MAFSLIELLVSIAVVGVLIGVLLPALAAGREAGRASVCLGNLRQIQLICQIYADENKGFGPAIGQPYTEAPNWAFVVQSSSGRAGTTSAEIYTRSSVLVCPTIAGVYGREMTRTYAMNATGHAGWIRPDGTRDPSNFDTPIDQLADNQAPAHIRFDLIDRPTDRVLLTDSFIDSAPVYVPASSADTTAPSTPAAVPPPTRTASVIDFRQPLHVQYRLGRGHARKSTIWVAFDGATRRQVIAPMDPPPADWQHPLP